MLLAASSASLPLNLSCLRISDVLRREDQTVGIPYLHLASLLGHALTSLDLLVSLNSIFCFSCSTVLLKALQRFSYPKTSASLCLPLSLSFHLLVFLPSLLIEVKSSLECMVDFSEFLFYLQSQHLTFMLTLYFFDAFDQVIFVFCSAFLVIF